MLPKFTRNIGGRVQQVDRGLPVSTAMTSRSEWMSILALSNPADLERHWNGMATYPAFTWIRRPETGCVVVRARASRTGKIFEMGDVTVTRCSVSIDAGIVGHAYVTGRDRRKAAIAAIFDALCQTSGEMKHHAEAVIVDLRSRLEARRKQASAQSYASAVDFILQLQEQP